jgi:hypothetical protein
MMGCCGIDNPGIGINGKKESYRNSYQKKVQL